MKISLLTRFFDSENGGIGIYSKNLLREFLDKEYDVDVHSSNYGGLLGYFIYTGPELFFHSKFLRDFDVYHALTPMESIWLPKKKSVVTFHDLNPLRDIDTHYSGLIARKWFGFASKRAINAEAIICNSQQTKDEVIELLGANEDKISVIRLGIGSHLKPVETNEDNYRVGTLCYLGPRKRVDILIKSFKKIEGKEQKLFIPSFGPEKSNLNELAGNDDRIEFLGYLKEEEKSHYLSSLDVFVLPSKVEGYGLPIIEAMRCKTPVVTLEDSMIPDDVKKRTHVTTPEKLTEDLEKRDFNCDVESNYEFSRLHNWSKCANETLEIYDGVRGD